MPPPPHDDNSLGSDLLRGLTAISRFIGEDEPRTSRLIRERMISAGRLGRVYVASRRLLRQHYAELTAGHAPQESAGRAA